LITPFGVNAATATAALPSWSAPPSVNIHIECNFRQAEIENAILDRQKLITMHAADAALPIHLEDDRSALPEFMCEKLSQEGQLPFTQLIQTLRENRDKQDSQAVTALLTHYSWHGHNEVNLNTVSLNKLQEIVGAFQIPIQLESIDDLRHKGEPVPLSLFPPKIDVFSWTSKAQSWLAEVQVSCGNQRFHGFELWQQGEGSLQCLGVLLMSD
jgi:hypothetical protein